MKVYDLVIIDEDEAYNQCLTKYIQSYHGTSFQVLSCSEKSHIERLLSDDLTGKILLISSHYYKKYRNKINGQPLHILLDGDEEVGNSSQYTIFKYQSGIRIVKEIERIIHQVYGEGESQKSKGSGSVIGVYSPIGGCGKSTIATALAGIMTQKQKTVYVNFEYIPSCNALLKGTNKYNLSDLIYYALKQEKIEDRLSEFICEDHDTGVHFIKPINAIEDLRDTDIDTLQKVVTLLTDIYPRVIIDFGSNFDQKFLELLQQCHVKVMIATDTRTSIEKLRNWVRLLQQRQHLKLDDYILINNMHKDNNEELTQVLRSPDVVINYSDIFFNTTYSELLESEIKQKIMAIIEHIGIKITKGRDKEDDTHGS